jgi:capsular polysaccharide biosynthesis protein
LSESNGGSLLLDGFSKYQIRGSPYPENSNLQNMANIIVFQAVAVPRKPVRSKKGLNIALGMISGAVPGTGFGFFIEYAGQGLSIPESGERHLGLPVCGAVFYKEKE